MEKKTFIIVLIIAIVGIVGSQTFYTVNQTDTAIVFRLGEMQKADVKPGLHVKIPFLENVVHLDSRNLAFDSYENGSAYTADKKTITIDFYTRWRIIDPLKFYIKYTTIENANDNLEKVIYSDLRQVVGQYTLTEVVNTKRNEIMDSVVALSNKVTIPAGVEIVDVRIKRTDLQADSNQNAIFKRMQTERERQANQYRSEGAEIATGIRSLAEKDRVALLAEANAQAAQIRGDGDAKAIKVYSDAHMQSPELFELLRTLEAYRNGLKGKTKIMLPLGENFLEYFK